MKRFLTTLLISAIIGLVAGPAHATLYDRGDGMIYDSDLNITWLQDANLAATNTFGVSGIQSGGVTNSAAVMSWYTAQSWIAAMDAANYGGYSDWRLPTTVPQNYNWGYDGTTGVGYNITTGSEMGYLYYTELGNLAPYDTSGNYQSGWGLNTGPFTNLQPNHYWSGTEYAPSTDRAWVFAFNGGGQGPNDKDFYYCAWAVRDGDVAAVPEPGTLMLLGSGLMGLVATRRLFGRRLR